MIEVEMSDDIRKYETKFMANFTLRQIVCIVIGICIGVPVALLVPTTIDNKIYIGMIAAMPALLCGWGKMAGMPYEIFFTRWIYRNILTPRKRKYKSENTYRKSLKMVRADMEKEKISKMSAKESKLYLKKKQNPKVTYSKNPEFKIYR